MNITVNTLILHQAFINMGYRSMINDESIWGKPVGFGIILAEVKESEITFKTMFENYQGEPRIWSSSKMSLNIETKGKELYKRFVFNIAYCEFEAKAEKMFWPFAGGNSRPYDF